MSLRITTYQQQTTLNTQTKSRHFCIIKVKQISI